MQNGISWGEKMAYANLSIYLIICNTPPTASAAVSNPQASEGRRDGSKLRTQRRVARVCVLILSMFRFLHGWMGRPLCSKSLNPKMTGLGTRKLILYKYGVFFFPRFFFFCPAGAHSISGFGDFFSHYFRDSKKKTKKFHVSGGKVVRYERPLNPHKSTAVIIFPRQSKTIQSQIVSVTKPTNQEVVAEMCSKKGSAA